MADSRSLLSASTLSIRSRSNSFISVSLCKYTNTHTYNSNSTFKAINLCHRADSKAQWAKNIMQYSCSCSMIFKQPPLWPHSRISLQQGIPSIVSINTFHVVCGPGHEYIHVYKYTNTKTLYYADAIWNYINLYFFKILTQIENIILCTYVSRIVEKEKYNRTIIKQSINQLLASLKLVHIMQMSFIYQN